MRVRPANPDAVIRDPRTRQPLPADGADVPDTNFWHRRIRSGEVAAVEDAGDRMPTGLEPVTPLTRREPAGMPGVLPPPDAVPEPLPDPEPSHPFDTSERDR